MLKNLKPDESKALHDLSNRSALKVVMPWAMKLSESRAETLKLQAAFDKYEREKETEIERLNRRILNLQAQQDNDKRDQEFWNALQEGIEVVDAHG